MVIRKGPLPLGLYLVMLLSKCSSISYGGEQMSKYTHKIYGTADIYLKSGFYSRDDIQEIIDWFNKTDAQLKASLLPEAHSSEQSQKKNQSNSS